MMQQQMMQQQMMQQQLMQQQMMQQQVQAQQAAMQNILNPNGLGNGPYNDFFSIDCFQGKNIPTIPSSVHEGEISVILRACGTTGQVSAPSMVQCMPDEKVSEIIEKYRYYSGDRDPSKKFIFNAQNLDLSLSAAEAGITNNANIFVVSPKAIKEKK